MPVLLMGTNLPNNKYFTCNFLKGMRKISYLFLIYGNEKLFSYTIYIFWIFNDYFIFSLYTNIIFFQKAVKQ